MRTAQELYETSVKHLRKQKQKSYKTLPNGEHGEQYACQYRSPDGHRCAIGCLIPDSDYKPEMEGKDLDDLLRGDLLPLKLAAEFHKHRRMLALLQFVHDQKPITDWESQFRMMADDFKLKYPSHESKRR